MLINRLFVEKVIVVSDLQPANASSPMLVTLSGMVTEVSFVQ